MFYNNIIIFYHRTKNIYKQVYFMIKTSVILYTRAVHGVKGRVLDIVRS